MSSLHTRKLISAVLSTATAPNLEAKSGFCYIWGCFLVEMSVMEETFKAMANG